MPYTVPKLDDYSPASLDKAVEEFVKETPGLQLFRWSKNGKGLLKIISIEKKNNLSKVTATFKEKNISWTFRSRSLTRVRLIITNEQYESTNTNHYCKISAFFHEQFSTIHTLKKIERTANRSEELNSFIVIILFTCNFSNFYFNLSEQLNA